MLKKLTSFFCLLAVLVACQASPTSSPTPAAGLLVAVTPTPSEAGTNLPGTPAVTPQANSAGFQNQFAVADRFTASLSNVPQVEAGHVYLGWLVSDVAQPLNVGVLARSPDGAATLSWTSPSGENLLARYRRFQVSVEPAPGAVTPAGKVVYQGELTPAEWETARRLFVQNLEEPTTPLNTAFALGLGEQLDIAIQHIHNAQNAAALNAQGEMRMHMEHVINIFEGASGPRFKDYTGDGLAQNPGDGFGVKGYARAMRDLLVSDEARATVTEMETQIDKMQTACEAILGDEDLEPARQQIVELLASAEALKNGPAAALYQQATKAIWFSVQPAP